MAPKNLVPIYAGNDGADIPGGSGSGWTAATLVNSWVNYTGYVPAQYRKVNGLVVFEGGIASGSSTVALTLPAGYRPSAQLLLPLEIYASGVFTTGFMIVNSTGPVQIETQTGAVPTAAFWSVCFYGDQ
jgi:hypothetical protein